MSLILKSVFSSSKVKNILVRQVRLKTDQVHPGYKRLRKNQERFQVNDGRPIHLKKGLPDRILYGLTMFLSLGGVAYSFKVYYDLIFPKEEGLDEEE